MKIHSVTSREILDSRGNPTVCAAVELTDGVIAEASVPSGASTGKDEAHELRDGTKGRFMGMGVLAAVKNIDEVIGPALVQFEGADQKSLDHKICELDGTKRKENLGANAILAVSLANARAQSISAGLELFQYLGLLYSGALRKNYTIPTPMFNVLNGGKHAENDVDVQEAMVVPLKLKSFEQKLRAGSEIYHILRNNLINKGYDVGLGDEGGFAPDIGANEETFGLLETAILDAGYSQDQVRMSIDVAASELLDTQLAQPPHLGGEGSSHLRGERSPRLSESPGNFYHLHNIQKTLSSDDMIAMISAWVKKYNLFSVEDGLSESDAAWGKLTEGIAPALSIGDDLFVTDPAKIKQGVKAKIAGGVIIKPNQIGALTETLEAVKEANKGGFSVVVSHRSGETEDSFIADLAVAVEADFIKAGAPARSERLAKYNRLSKIEDVLNCQ